MANAARWVFGSVAIGAFLGLLIVFVIWANGGYDDPPPVQRRSVPASAARVDVLQGRVDVLIREELRTRYLLCLLADHQSFAGDARPCLGNDGRPMEWPG